MAKAKDFRMRFAYALCAAVILSGCMTDPKQAFLIQSPPSQWGHEQDVQLHIIGPLSPCQAYRRGYWMNDTIQQPFTKADYAALEKRLRGAGLNSRDFELLRDGGQSYGTGQTYVGLVCSLGYEPYVNKAFYPGIGHQWQVVTQYQSYIYLQGDGTERGMRVTGWN